MNSSSHDKPPPGGFSSSGSRFPLGVPKNRAVDSGDQLAPIEGRPNWFRDKHGREVYREPNSAPQQGNSTAGRAA
jgi:hypothetical protein